MGQPVVPWELWSEDPERVSSFYKRVFGWEIRHVPEMNYRLVETGGTGGINGGIMTPQKEPWPGKLAFYIDVDDIDAFARKVREAGGKIVVDKVDVPGVGQSSCSRIRTGGCWGCGSNSGSRVGEPRERRGVPRRPARSATARCAAPPTR